ncbi:MAG: hypothetical protein K1X66_00645 [Verrucomicrobiae bacterium]|nr:hypothetical protein [Verrucomicrobiae bacterium]
MKIGSLIMFFLSAICVSRAEEIFPVSQIKAGMKGTTYTVLQGTNIVPLETEVLGVSEDYLGPGKDLIIAKLVDEKTKLTGAVHGMSGSPLYIEGKLAGALSRRIAVFEKDGHCGFTPIADMLVVNQKSKDVKTVWHPERFFPGYSWLQNDEKSGWLSLPLSMSGVSGYAKKIMEKIWEGSGFFMAAGGGGGRGQSQRGTELLPGAPVSVAFLTGDLHMAGTGTVTWRQGDQLLAFGHPMFGWGDVELPLCEAEIISTIPSYYMPFKLANVRRTVGTLTQDRLSAVGGVVGPVPTLPRYRVTVQWEDQQPKIYEGNFVSHELFTPAILASLVGSVLLENDEASAKWSVALKGQLGLKGHEPLNFDAFSSGDESDAMGLIFGVAQRVGDLYGQRLEKVEPEFFDVNLQVKPSESVFTVESVQIEPQRPEPGQEIKVRVMLRPKYGEVLQKNFSFVLPDKFNHDDDVTLQVANGQLFYLEDQQDASSLRRFPFWPGNDGSDKADSLRDLLRQWNQQRSANELVVRLLSPEMGMRFREKRLENLPPSVMSVLANADSDSSPIFSSRVMEESTRLDGEITGKTGITFTVK